MLPRIEADLQVLELNGSNNADMQPATVASVGIAAGQVGSANSFP
jgi:hypothetical protein